MPQSIETLAPQPPRRAGELTHFSGGLNAFLTASILGGRGDYEEFTISISQAGHITTFLPPGAWKNLGL